MNLTTEQKNTLKKIIELLGDEKKLALYIFELIESFNTSKSEWEKLSPMVKQALSDIESLRPVKGKDYCTEEEFQEMVSTVLSQVPEPQTVDEARLISETLREVEKSIKNSETSLGSAFKKEINRLEKLVSAVPQFDPSALKQEIQDVVKKIPTIPDFKTDTGEKIIEKINALPIEPEYQIDKEHIKGLIDEIKELRSLITSRPAGNIGMRKVPIVKRINLTSQCNGVTKTFSLPKDTIAVLGVWGTQFPITFDEADFTLTGNNLVLTDEVSAPDTGQTLMALVETLFY